MDACMTGAFCKVSEFSPEVRVVAELLYPLLCPEMINTEINLTIWKVLLGFSALRRKPPIEIFDNLPHPFPL